jgi:hypothetical protein
MKTEKRIYIYIDHVTIEEIKILFGGEISEDGTMWTAPDDIPYPGISFVMKKHKSYCKIEPGTELTDEQVNLIKTRDDLLFEI